MGSEIVLDDEKVLRLLHIDEELMEICHWLSEQRESQIVARLIPLADDLTVLLDQLGLEKAR